MDAHRIMEDMQESQGWTDATALDLALDYITNQMADDAFRDFLQEHAADDEEA